MNKISSSIVNLLVFIMPFLIMISFYSGRGPDLDTTELLSEIYAWYIILAFFLANYFLANTIENIVAYKKSFIESFLISLYRSIDYFLNSLITFIVTLFVMCIVFESYYSSSNPYYFDISGLFATLLICLILRFILKLFLIRRYDSLGRQDIHDDISNRRI